jgi:hypothetical protein
MRWGLGLLAAVAAWGLVATSAARGDDKPVLMLDTGGHQALIRGIAFTDHSANAPRPPAW